MKNLFLFFSLVLAWQLSGQETPALKEFNQERQALTRTGMLVLGGWAISNMSVSGLSLATGSFDQRPAVRSFHQMNLGWNAVNLAIASFGYFGSQTDPSSLSLAESLQAQESIQRTLLFNAGLDLAYMAGGAYLLERAKTSQKPARDRGFGRAVILNGAFLFVFDAILFWLHHRRSDSLYEWLPQIQAGAQQVGLVWRW